MHEYAIFDHDRSSIGRTLGFLAIAISGGIAQILAIAQNVTGIDAFTRATITTSMVYLLLHYTFNKWIWKIPYFKIPDLNGTWAVSGKTLNEDGTIRYTWNGHIGIEQTWQKIIIHMKTENSQSKSYTATLSQRHGPTGGWLLSYSYKNEPEIEQEHELNAHKGYCEIDFNSELTYGKAAYFNSAGRRTFGAINLTKE